MIEIIPFYVENKLNANVLDIRALYAENRPKIEVATSDISGAITVLAAAQEAKRFRNEAEDFSELTNSDRIQTGLDAQATAEDRQVVEAYVGDINNLVTIPFTQFAIDLIRTQTIVVEHHGFT